MSTIAWSSSIKSRKTNIFKAYRIKIDNYDNKYINTHQGAYLQLVFKVDKLVFVKLEKYIHSRLQKYT